MTLFFIAPRNNDDFDPSPPTGGGAVILLFRTLKTKPVLEDGVAGSSDATYPGMDVADYLGFIFVSSFDGRGEKGFAMRSPILTVILASTALASTAMAKDTAWYVGVGGGRVLCDAAPISLHTTAGPGRLGRTGCFDIDGVIGYDLGTFTVFGGTAAGHDRPLGAQARVRPWPAVPTW